MILTTEDITRIKQKVQNEMKRRDAATHNASLAEYGSENWSFTVNPETGCAILDEHVQKLIDPLLQVNDFLHDNSIRTGKSGLEIPLDRIEEFVDKLSQIEKTASNSGCRGNCTGLCESACESACMSCTNCTGKCSDACSKGCADNCGGGCGGCSTGCFTTCTNTCGSGCTTSTRR